MNRYRKLTISCMLVLVLVPCLRAQFAGPAVTEDNAATVTPRTAAAPVRAYLIHPGDVLGLQVIGAPDIVPQSFTTTSLPTATTASINGIKVDALGQLQLPYIGMVHLGGLSVEAAIHRIADLYRQRGILNDPQILLTIVESPSSMITVGGEVQHPCTVPAYGAVRLLDAIAACGGLLPTASHTITVQRNGLAQPITVLLPIDARQAGVTNIALEPGDTVLASRVGNLYVLGAVKTPQFLPMNTNAPITVMRAIAMAGGVSFSAGLSQARILRTTADNAQTEIRFDLGRIMRGKDPDFVLAANDVLYLPNNWAKGAISSGGVATLMQLIYEATYMEVMLR